MNRLLGCTLLVVGTGFGAGMLSLPVVTAGMGLYQSTELIVFAWVTMTLGALYMAEVNAWFHQGNNIVWMAKQTLGRVGQTLSWIVYLVLLYALMSAYIAGGSGVVQSLAPLVHVSLPSWLSTLIFTILLGAIVWFDVSSVDRANRLLMTIKIAVFLGLVALITPHAQLSSHLSTKINHSSVLAPLTIIVTSFGFAGSVPTFGNYLNYNMHQLRIAILVGSSFMLLCYLGWNAVVQGAVNTDSLLAIGVNHGGTAELTLALIDIVQSPMLTTFIHLFVSICMLTSFICVSLGLTDFLADGIRVKKAEHKKLIYGLTFIPPLLITLFYPTVFISALRYAGICCLLLLTLLPPLMSWSGRYQQPTSQHKLAVWGGKPLLLLLISCAALLTLYAIIQEIG